MADQILTGTTATSEDVLRIEHRNSEPFDHPVNPTDLANDAVDWDCGEVACITTSGYVGVADKDNIATIKLIGLFVLPRNPQSGLKNNYVDASGNASVFSNGIVTLNRQIVDATVAAGADLYVGDAGKITTAVTAGCKIGIAMTGRTAVTDNVRVKLEL